MSLFQIFLILLIPFALPRTFGRMVGDKRQGYAILGVMATLAAASTALRQLVRGPRRRHGHRAGRRGDGGQGGPLRRAAVGAVRRRDDADVDRCGQLDARQLHAAGRRCRLLNMMLGEVAPGGVGSGLYGMLVLAVIAVFVAGLMVGRTPEYLGKRLGGREMTLASLYLIAVPAIVLIGTAVAMAVPAGRESMLNAGPHGLSEVLYAFTSAANNNGSAFAGLSANTPFYNTALGLAMAFGRFVPIVLVLALAGSAGRAGPHRGHRRHVPDAPPAVRRAAHRRDARRRRSHLLPGARAGSAR